VWHSVLLTAAVALLLAAWWIGTSEFERLHLALEQRGRTSLVNALSAFVHSLAEMASDVLLLSQDRDVQATLGHDTAAAGRLGRGYQAFMEAKPEYRQIRWIDDSGRERLRVGRCSTYRATDAANCSSA
jgi:two-component system, sensor histidine kinase and response regulator